MPTNILIINLGTPDNPNTKTVRNYLREFLSDPYVIEKPRWFWLPILYAIILNIRPKQSAKKYQKIWTKQGSPLLIYSKKIVEKLKQNFPEANIELGMRYGKPSLKEALNKLDQNSEILVLPLYPQYARSTTLSTTKALEKLSKNISIIPDYHANPLYIKTLTNSIKTFWQQHGRAQKLILSFHGLPQSIIKKGDPYYQQCQETTKLLATELQLTESEYQLSFQSRVGPEPWLQPYTKETMIKLAQDGIKHIQTLCPGFPCDCLETLEEINIENRNFFLNAGGEKFEYIPCLNDTDAHINLLTALIKENNK